MTRLGRHRDLACSGAPCRRLSDPAPALSWTRPPSHSVHPVAACRRCSRWARGGWSWELAEFRWMQLRAALPSATFAIHHVIGRSDPHLPHRAAVRWSLDDTHDGFGAFGKRSGTREVDPALRTTLAGT